MNIIIGLLLHATVCIIRVYTLVPSQTCH